MGTSKNSFLLRTAAIYVSGVVRPKCVLDIALAMPVAILTFRLAGENFARSRNKSNFLRLLNIIAHRAVKTKFCLFIPGDLLIIFPLKEFTKLALFGFVFIFNHRLFANIGFELALIGFELGLFFCGIVVFR